MTRVTSIRVKVTRWDDLNRIGNRVVMTRKAVPGNRIRQVVIIRAAEPTADVRGKSATSIFNNTRNGNPIVNVTKQVSLMAVKVTGDRTTTKIARAAARAIRATEVMHARNKGAVGTRCGNMKIKGTSIIAKRKGISVLDNRNIVRGRKGNPALMIGDPNITRKDPDRTRVLRKATRGNSSVPGEIGRKNGGRNRDNSAGDGGPRARNGILKMIDRLMKNGFANILEEIPKQRANGSWRDCSHKIGVLRNRAASGNMTPVGTTIRAARVGAHRERRCDPLPPRAVPIPRGAGNSPVNG
jgi:hypothetical protein